MSEPAAQGSRLRPPELRPGQGGTGMQVLAVLAAAVAALYFGRDIFVPIALAGLLSFALAPLVSWLRRRHVPRTPAVIAVVLLAFLAIFAFGLVIAGQVSQLGSNLPQYQSNIQEKIRSLRSTTPSGGMVERASEMLRELGDEIEQVTEDAADDAGTVASAQDPQQVEPIPVQIQQPDPAPLEILQTIIGPLIAPLATGGIVVVFLIFILLQREDLRDRFIRLAGGRGDLHRMTLALGDAGKRVGRYLLMQLIVNATYGIPVGIGLWLIGVPNPVLWGILAMILRFVPYIGPVIAAMFPLVLAIAVDPGWTMLVWTAALFIGLELISNNIVEPWLYGSSTGLSPVAIIAAAIFWTWLWGPVGLLLSTPLTVCLVVLGRHVPQFAFLDVLLGSEPVLTPAEGLYQRLLAGDPEEATERAEEFLEERPLLAYYDEVAFPALAMAEMDRARCVLDDEQRALLVASALTLVDNLSDHEEDAGGGDEARLKAEEVAAETTVATSIDASGYEAPIVLCAGGRGSLDDVASAILAQLLERNGIRTRLVPHDALRTASDRSIDMSGAQVLCVSYMNADSIAHARYLVRRLRRRSQVPVMLGFWAPAPENAEQVAEVAFAEAVVRSLGETLDRITDLTGRQPAGRSNSPRGSATRASDAFGTV